MNFYWRDREEFINDDNLYVEFKTEADMLNAIHKNIHYRDFRVKGIKRGVMWPITHIYSKKTTTIDKETSIQNNKNTTHNLVATGANTIPINNSRIIHN